MSVRQVVSGVDLSNSPGRVCQDPFFPHLSASFRLLFSSSFQKCVDDADNDDEIAYFTVRWKTRKLG